MPLLLTVLVLGKIAAVAVGASHWPAALALWFAPDFLLAYHLFAPRAQGVVRSACRFATAQPEVWLTIDDGPDPIDNPRLLAALERHGARATFFLIGERVRESPGRARAIAAAGHEVGNHTQTHPLAFFWCAGPRRVAREVDECLAALRAEGLEARRFRPPVGIKNPWLAGVLRRHGLDCIGWSARGRESVSRDPDVVVARVLRGLAPGAILLLHEGCGVPAALRVTVVERVLAQLAARGYRCVIPRPDQLDGI